MSSHDLEVNKKDFRQCNYSACAGFIVYNTKKSFNKILKDSIQRPASTIS